MTEHHNQYRNPYAENMKRRMATTDRRSWLTLQRQMQPRDVVNPEAEPLEPYWIDAATRETNCDNCAIPLICGDQGFISPLTFTVGCCEACVRDFDRKVAEQMADVKCAEVVNGKGGAA